MESTTSLKRPVNYDPRNHRKLADSDMAKRFWSKVDKSGPVPTLRAELGPCWVWLACKDQRGYGRFSLPYTNRQHRRIQYAHITAFVLSGKSLADGLVIDHLCRNRSCVNPQHLEAVTTRTNLLRGIGGAAERAARTHCPYGHPYSSENTYVSRKNQRHCRECHRLHRRKEWTN